MDCVPECATVSFGWRKMEESDDPGGGISACCRMLAEKLRAEFESRIVALEAGAVQTELRHEDYNNQLKEIIALRDEQLLVANGEIKERDLIINQLKQEVENSKERVEQLTKKIDGLLMNRKNTETKTIPRPKRQDYRPADLSEVFSKECFPEFFVMSFKNGEKSMMCPFNLERELVTILGGNPRSISGSGRNSLIVRVCSKHQGEKMATIKEILGKECQVNEHDFFNITKGLIYIYNNDLLDFDSFQQGIKEQYPVAKVVEATWIKPRNGNSKAFLLSFTTENIPSCMRIIGEYTNTKVYPFIERPMQCAKCQKYGHVTKRCGADKFTCGNCAENHKTVDCSAEIKRCQNCGGNHATRDPSCEERKREEQILLIQRNEKVGRNEAWKIMNGEGRDNLTRQNPSYEKYIEVKMEAAELRKMCPFKLEKSLKEKYNIQRSNITTTRRGFVVKSDSPSQSETISKAKSIAGISCEVEEHRFYNESRGLIYVTGFEIDNEVSFEQGLKFKYNIKEVKHANWIKTRNNNAKPFLITFNQPNILHSIIIPGQGRVSVNEYKNRPMFCTTCLEYSHSRKNCKNNLKCKICTGNHISDNCTKNPSCMYCSGGHRTGATVCQKQREEQAICDIQQRKKVTWTMAKQEYYEAAPKKSFADTVRSGASKTTTHETQVNRGREVEEMDTAEVIASTSGANSKTPNTERRMKRQQSSEEIASAPSKRGRNLEIKADKDANDECASNLDTSIDVDVETSETNEKLRGEAKKIFKEYRTEVSIHQ